MMWLWRLLVNASTLKGVIDTVETAKDLIVEEYENASKNHERSVSIESVDRQIQAQLQPHQGVDLYYSTDSKGRIDIEEIRSVSDRPEIRMPSLQGIRSLRIRKPGLGAIEANKSENTSQFSVRDSDDQIEVYQLDVLKSREKAPDKKGGDANLKSADSNSVSTDAQHLTPTEKLLRRGVVR